jgi:CCR4-NOT transcription complex subunit 2
MEATSATSSTASSVDGRSVGGGGAGASDYLNLGMFNAGGGGSQQLGDLLGGAGGFPLGNGFGSNDQANSAGGVSSAPPGTSFDLSDFPSLGGTGGNAQVGSAAGNGLAAALRQQQQILAHQQMLQNSSSLGAGGGTPGSKSSNLYRLAMTGNGNFNMATEDFPALSGTPGGGGGPGGPSLSAQSLLSGGSNSGVVSRAPSNGHAGGLYGSELESGNSQLDGAGLLGGAGLGGLGGLRGLQQAGNGQGSSLSRTPSATPSAGAIGNPAGSGGGPGSAAGSALSGDYGLLGLLGVIRMTDADRNALALGSDLAMLGLNLGTTDQIYSTFSSPWNDSAAKEPHYQVR